MFRDPDLLAGRPPARAETRLPWIGVAPGAPYFVAETGEPWTPIGHNDAISWVTLDGLFRRRDLPAVEAYLAGLAASGVTVLRLMLEYAQVRHRYVERPIGRFVPAMVRLWDDLFAICERVGLRILLTPVDTFWTWLHWRHHPYNRANGGPLDDPSRLLLCRETRDAIKARLAFAAERWGGSGALFAYDLWNEIHPAQAGDSAEVFPDFIADLSRHLRAVEIRLHGRAHPQTVSLFGPELRLRPDMPLAEPIFRHPDLDFATIHVYEQGTIDDPRDTVAPALGMAGIVRACIGETRDGRPFLDTEHGPIHSFKDRKLTLPEAFDDECFRHMQWAHLAAGGAGGGMRWPNRHPHRLTPGMHRAQAALAAFLPLVDWLRFRRRPVEPLVGDAPPGLAAVACADEAQALAWLVLRDTIGPDGRLRADAAPVTPRLVIPGPAPGRYRVTAFDTARGMPLGAIEAVADGRGLAVDGLSVATDLALAARRVDG
ncbi:MAG TPA: hypothetical protein VEA41_10795 [Salinarimonas sp.]|nr:hypothetical protein [Salinarimonas sp.]